MATDIHSDSGVSMSRLISGIIDDASRLIRQEVELARSEIKQEIIKTKRAVISLGVGIAVAAIGGLLLLLMVVQILHEVAGLDLWVSYAIVGGILAVAGSALFFYGKSQAADVQFIPRQTVQSMQENIQWIKNQT